MLDGPPKEWIGDQNAREIAHATNHPQSGAMSQPAANALDDRKSDAGRPSPDLSKKFPTPRRCSRPRRRFESDAAVLKQQGSSMEPDRIPKIARACRGVRRRTTLRA